MGDERGKVGLESCVCWWRTAAKLWRSTRGATTAEYAMLLALVVVVLLGVLSELGFELRLQLDNIVDELRGVR